MRIPPIALILLFVAACTTATAGSFFSGGDGAPVEVEAGPRGAFGELITAPLIPRVQIDAIYGVNASDVETFTNGAGAQATASGGLFVVDSGTDALGSGTLRSARIARYRPGQGMRARWTAKFDAGVASYLSGAGMFTSTDGVWVGYLGTDFGITRRIPGALEIRTLTVTTGATGAGTIAVELDGATTNTTIGGALSTAATCETIAQETYTGWDASCTGSVVTYQSDTPAVLSGAFSFGAGATGAAATGPTQVLAGAANDHTTDFVALTAANIDPLDGTGPSRIVLDPSKLNVWEATIAYLGAGNITVAVMSPRTGRFVPVHTYQYPNANTTPNAGNPTYRVGWFSTSEGSTTSLEVAGASAVAFVEGVRLPFRDPHAASRTALTVSTEVAILSIRNETVFGGIANQREVDPQILTLGVDGIKPAEIRVCLNGTLSGVPAWTDVGFDSSVAVEESNGLTHTGCQLVAALAIEGGSSAAINLAGLDLRLHAGDTLTILGTIVGGAGNDITVALTWQEN